LPLSKSRVKPTDRTDRRQAPQSWQVKARDQQAAAADQAGSCAAFFRLPSAAMLAMQLSCELSASAGGALGRASVLAL